MRRYQVVGVVLGKTSSRLAKETVIAVSEADARRVFGRDYDVLHIDSVTDVTDVDTGWKHVAFVQSDSDPDRTHEIRKNKKTDVVACGCKAFQFSKGSKTCHHLQALGIAVATPAVLTSISNGHVQTAQQVSVTRNNKTESFTVTRRAISLGPIRLGGMR